MGQTVALIWRDEMCGCERTLPGGLHVLSSDGHLSWSQEGPILALVKRQKISPEIHCPRCCLLDTTLNMQQLGLRACLTAGGLRQGQDCHIPRFLSALVDFK